MIISIADLLSPSEVEEMRKVLAGVTFQDGRLTAGWNARLVKNNEQAAASRPVERLRETTASAILANEIFSLAVRPKALTPLIFSRYETGRSYGSHVDDALMGGLRTDVSFTLFLSDPDSYEGGELVIETTSGEEAFKLPAGSLVVYPSTTLHRVADVTSGVRLAAVGWARSLLRSAEQRELLFDLDRARRSLFARDGKTTEFDLISKSTANLLRMWVDD